MADTYILAGRAPLLRRVHVLQELRAQRAYTRSIMNIDGKRIHNIKPEQPPPKIRNSNQDHPRQRYDSTLEISARSSSSGTHETPTRTKRVSPPAPSRPSVRYRPMHISMALRPHRTHPRWQAHPCRRRLPSANPDRSAQRSRHIAPRSARRRHPFLDGKRLG